MSTSFFTVLFTSWSRFDKTRNGTTCHKSFLCLSISYLERNRLALFSSSLLFCVPQGFDQEAVRLSVFAVFEHPAVLVQYSLKLSLHLQTRWACQPMKVSYGFIKILLYSRKII